MLHASVLEPGADAVGFRVVVWYPARLDGNVGRMPYAPISA